MNQIHTDQGAITSPPCPHSGQPMTDRDLGEKDEFQCKACQIALSPLADMCLEDGLMLTYSITDKEYKELPHCRELVQWLEKVNANYSEPRLKTPSFMEDEPAPR